MMQLLLLSSLCLDNMPEQSNDYRVVVFGAGGVGKSSLVLRFVRGTFRDSYIPTIEDTYRQVISCNKQVLYLLSSSSLLSFFPHFPSFSSSFLLPYSSSPPPNLLPNPADMQSSWPLYYNERRNLQFTKSKFVCKCCLLLFFQTPTRVGYAMKLWQKQDTGKYKNNGTRNESDNINSYRPSETNVYYRPYINTR